jgi:hypothetical protein
LIQVTTKRNAVEKEGVTIFGIRAINEKRINAINSIRKHQLVNIQDAAGSLKRPNILGIVLTIVNCIPAIKVTTVIDIRPTQNNL